MVAHVHLYRKGEETYIPLLACIRGIQFVEHAKHQAACGDKMFKWLAWEE